MLYGWTVDDVFDVCVCVRFTQTINVKIKQIWLSVTNRTFGAQTQQNKIYDGKPVVCVLE